MTIDKRYGEEDEQENCDHEWEVLERELTTPKYMQFHSLGDLPQGTEYLIEVQAECKYCDLVENAALYPDEELPVDEFENQYPDSEVWTEISEFDFNRGFAYVKVHAEKESVGDLAVRKILFEV